MKLLSFLIISSILILKSESLELTCGYDVPYYSEYCCIVINRISVISKDDREVTKVSGIHKEGKNDDDVVCISFNEKQLNFFPTGLTKFYKNLKTLSATRAGIKEISQEDFKVFGENLTTIYFGHNKIQVIEADIFEFNPNLEKIYLHSNKITHIEEGALESLEKLNTITFNGNPCSMKGYNDFHGSRTKVLEFIEKLEYECKDENYTPRTTTTTTTETPIILPEDREENFEFNFIIFIDCVAICLIVILTFAIYFLYRSKKREIEAKNRAKIVELNSMGFKV